MINKINMIYLIDFIIVLYSYLITQEQTPASPPHLPVKNASQPAIALTSSHSGYWRSISIPKTL